MKFHDNGERGFISYQRYTAKATLEYIPLCISLNKRKIVLD